MNEETPPKVVMRPQLRSINDNFLDPFKMIMKGWAPILLLQVVAFALTMMIVTALLFTTLGPVVYKLYRGGHERELLNLIFSAPYMISIVGLVLCVTLVWTFAKVGIIASFMGEGDAKPSISDAFKAGLKLFLPVFYLVFIIRMAVFGAYWFLIFPAIILYCGLVTAPFIAVVERIPLMRAIQTSWEISRGHKWSIFGRMLLLGIIMYAVSAVLMLVSMVPIFGIGAVPLQLFYAVVAFPYSVAYFFCIYQDIRRLNTASYKPKGKLFSSIIVCLLISVATIYGIIWSVCYFVVQR